MPIVDIRKDPETLTMTVTAQFRGARRSRVGRLR